jgi:hypothetical protein
LRPAAFFWAVVPPWAALDPEPERFPPLLDAPGELAIFAARSFDMPFFFKPSYCFSFLTLALLLGIENLDPGDRARQNSRDLPDGWYDKRPKSHWFLRYSRS